MSPPVSAVHALSSLGRRDFLQTLQKPSPALHRLSGSVGEPHRHFCTEFSKCGNGLAGF